MKTIYARLGDLQLGDTLEDGTTVGQIGDALGKVGINIQTANGDLRNMGDVIEELMGKWEQLTTAEQQALAVKLAGKYQYNNLIALLDNAEMYNEQLEASENSLGTINQQQQIYMDSLEGKLNSMQSAFEGLLGSIFNVDDIKPAIDDITELIKLMTSFTSSIGSSSLFAGIIGTGTRIFSKNIADSVGNMVKNRQDRRRKDNDAISGKNMLRDIGEDPSKFQEKSATFQAAKALGSRTNIMNEDQLKRAQSLLKQMAAQENEILAKRQQSQAAIAKLNAAYKMVDATAEEVKLTEDGQIENLEKAKATIENIKTAFEGVDSASKELSLNLEKALPSLTQSLEALTQAETLTGSQMNGKRRRGNNQATAAVSLISNKDIFNLDSQTGQDYQRMFGSMESFTALGAAYSEASKQIDAYNKAQTHTEEEMTQYKQAIEDVRNKLVAFVQELRGLGDVSSEDVQKLEKLFTSLREGEIALDQMNGATKDLKKELDFKDFTMSIASIAGDLAQLYGVMESIKSLGSIVADDSISGLEKFGQMAQNLLFTSPMLLSSLSSITTEIGNVKSVIKNFKNGFREVAENATKAGGAVATFGEKISGAFSAVGVGSPQALAAIAAITAAAMAASAIIGYNEEKAVQAAEKAEKAYNDSVEKLDKLKSNQEKIDNFNELYGAFKETGIITDDLKASIEELNDIFGISIDVDTLKKDSIDDLADSYANLSTQISDSEVKNANLAQNELFNKDLKKVKYSDHDEDYRLFGTYFGIGEDVDVKSVKTFNPRLESEPIDDTGTLDYFSRIWGLYRGKPLSMLGSTEDLGTFIYKELFDNILDNQANGYFSEGGFTSKASEDKVGAIQALESGLSYLDEIYDEADRRLKNDLDLSDAERESLEQTMSEVEALRAELNSYISPEDRANFLSFQKIKADASAQEVLSNFTIDPSKTDEENANVLLNNLLSQNDIVDYMTLLGEEAGDAYVSGYISSVSNGDLARVSAKVVSDEGDNRNIAAKSFAYLGVTQDAVFNEEGGLKGQSALSDYNILSLSGLSAAQIQSGFEVADAHGIGWSELKTAIGKLTNAGYSMDEAFLLLTDTSSECMAALADGRDSVLDSIVENKKQQDELDSLVRQQAENINFDRAKAGKAALSDEEALAEAQEELASVLESSLPNQEKIGIVNGYLAGDIQDLDAAVVEAASGFESLPELNQDSNTFLQQRYNEVLDIYSTNAGDLKDSPVKVANEYISRMFSGLTDEMITEISELAPDDFDRLNSVVENLVEMGYGAAIAWEYALSGVEDAASEISPENFEASQRAKGIFGQQRTSYYKTSQGYVSGDDIINDYNELRAYVRERGGDFEDLVNNGKIDFSKSTDEIKKDIDEMVLGFDSSRDLVNTFRDNLANNLSLVGGSSDKANELIDSFAEYDDETLQVLDDLGLLKEENLEILLAYLEAADGDKDKLLLMANRMAEKQSGDVGGLDAAENFVNSSSGTGLSKVGGASDLDGNYRNDEAESLWNYATDLGFKEETFSMLSDQASEMNLSTQEFKQWMENLTYGIDSVSEHAQSAANALLEAGYSEDEARTSVAGFSQSALDTMDEAGLFKEGNEQLFGSLVGNYNEEQILEIIPYLDQEKLDEQLAELNQNPAIFYLKAEVSNAQDVVDEVISAVESGSEIDSATLSKLYDIAPALKDISLYGEDGKRALKDLKDELDAFEVSVLSLQRSELLEKTKDLEIEVNTTGSEEARKELKKIQDQIDGIDNEIDIKIRTDASETFNDLAEEEQRVESFKKTLRENGGLISGEDFAEIAQYYDGIVDIAEQAGNDKMQIDQNEVENFIAGMEQEQQAHIETKTQQLQAEADYYGAMADAHQAAADSYSQMADSELQTDEEVASTKAAIDDELNENENNALNTLAENNASVASSEMQNSADVANQNNEDNSLMVTNTQGALSTMSSMYAQWATNAIINANQVATAMSNAAKGQQSPASGGVVGGVSGGYEGNNSTSGKSKNTATINTPQGGWNTSNYRDRAKLEAENQQKLADGFHQAQQAILAQIEAAKSFTLPESNSIGGSGSGSGGGSGSGSEYDPKTKDALDDEADRYEKVNAQIDKLANTLEQLNTEEERLVGFNRSDMITKETENIQRQIEVYKEKLKLQKEELEEKKKALEGYGVEFDNEGYISNYQEKFKAYLDGINNLIAQYNAATDEETQNALEEQIETAQDGFEDFKDLVEKYDELNSKSIKETEKEIQDLHDKIEDMMLDIFNKAVDAANSIKDVNDKWAEFLKATDARDSDNPILSMEIASKKLANFFDDSSDSVNKYYDTAIARYEELKKKTTDPAQQAAIQKLIDNAKVGKATQGKGTFEEGGSGYLDMLLSNGKLLTDNINQYNKTGKSDLFGENQAGMMEAAQTVYDQITDAIVDFRSAIDDLQDAIIDSIDYMAEKIEEIDDQYDNVSKRLDHTSTMLAYAYGDKAYDQQIQVYQTQLNLQKSQLTNSIASRNKLKEVASSLKEGSKERKEAEEKLQEQEEKIYEQTENIAETSSQLLNAQANNSVNKWVNSLFNFGDDKMGTDLDWYATQWELINRNADYYLDDVNKAYNIQKLQSQYVDLLDNTSALSTQKKITEQMNQQLEYLRTKTKLSEYDVSYAQAQLEILKQQIALEEAQANKSQMKLRRDSQGNYNYVYTANQDDVKSAQDGLLDAQNNAYNLSKDNMRQSQEDSLSAIQQIKQTLIDIWTDANLTVEEKQARMKFVIDNFKQYISSTGEQISTSEANIINDFYGMVESLTDANADGLSKIYDDMKAGSLDAFNKIDGHWGNIMSNVTSYISDMEDLGSDLIDNMTSTVEDYSETIAKAAEDSGVNLKDIESNFSDINSAVGTLESSCKELQTTLSSVAASISAMGNSLEEYQQKILSLTNENSELNKIITQLRADLNKVYHETAAGATESAATGGVNSGKGNGSSSNGGNGTTGTGDGVARVGDTATLKADRSYYYNSWGVRPLGNMFAGIPNGVTIDFTSPYGSSTHPIHIKSTYDKDYTDLGWVTLDDLEGYDTGGYTGDWNDSSGKLALLHSKEIVLNAADTENILKAVESVRAMTSAMKGVSLAEAVGSIGNLGRSIESSFGTVDQNVSITAEFPNATSADEIRDAILGLNNQVLHYAHKRV